MTENCLLMQFVRSANTKAADSGSRALIMDMSYIIIKKGTVFNDGTSEMVIDRPAFMIPESRLFCYGWRGYRFPSP